MSDPVRPAPDVGFTVNEVATFLGVHRATILREVKRGNLRAVKVAARTRILQKDLDVYFDRKRKAIVA